MADNVQLIKERLSIVDVVAPYVELHKAGKNFKGKSPFTNEKTPSFYVSPDRGMYYCFSSSQGGDIFTFIEKMEGVDFKGALKMLAEKAGVELVPEDPKKRTERDRQYDILEAATAFFEKRFLEEAAARTYLEERGVTPETRAKWRIGYAPGPPNYGWREVKTYLEEKGYTRDELLRAGLIKGADTGKEPYDVFRDRVMFPIMDASGRVVAFSGRILTKDTEAPKYVNSPETELFVKSDVLFGYDKAKEGMRKLGFSLIVEGQFDVVLAHQVGYTNTVAVSGTALTAHHVDLLQRLSNRVALALDDDRAGIAAVKRAADLMLARSMDVKVARMQAGQDPADMIQADVDQFKDTIKHATHVIEYLLAVLADGQKDERTFKLLVREEVLPYVAKIPNAIDRDHFEKLVAERIGSTKDAIHTEVTRIMTSANSAPAQQSETRSYPLGQASTDQYEAYAEQIFGAIEYIMQSKAFTYVVDNVAATMRYVLEDRYEELAERMTGERLNKVLMQFEQTFADEPNRAFFEHLATRLNRFHEMHLKSELQKETNTMRELEQAGEFGPAYDTAMQNAHALNEKLGQYYTDSEQLLQKSEGK